jgi:hypothetical protein
MVKYAVSMQVAKKQGRKRDKHDEVNYQIFIIEFKQVDFAEFF